MLQQLEAQTIRYLPDYPVAGSGLYSLHFRTPFSLVANPAAHSATDSLEAGIFSEKKYLLDDLTSSLLVAAIPLSLGSFGLEANYFGSSEYHETGLAIAYAVPLGLVDIGAKFNYHNLQRANYGKARTVYADIGVLWQLADRLRAGLALNNILGSGYGRERPENLARAFSLGIGYEFSDQFYGAIEINKEEQRTTDLRAELNYHPTGHFFLRVSARTATNSGWFSAGWKWKSWRTDIVCSYHLLLGISPGISIVFYQKKQGK